MSAATAASRHPSSPRREAIIAERKRLGHDGRDEVWEGVYIMSPAAYSNHGFLQMQMGRVLFPLAEAAGLRVVGPYNLGTEDDYRIPDLGLMRPGPFRTYGTDDTALVVEILSPDDDSYKKFGFYFRHGVEEILLVDPGSSGIEWYVRSTVGFETAMSSPLLGVSVSEVITCIEW